MSQQDLPIFQQFYFVMTMVTGLLLTGCGVTSTAGGIAITGIGTSLAANEAVQLHVIMTTTTGEKRDVSDAASWASSNLSAAIVDANGRLTTRSAGQTEISASIATLNATTTSVITISAKPTIPLPVNPPPVNPSPAPTQPVAPAPINTGPVTNPSRPVAPTSYPIPVYSGVDFSNLPTLSVSDNGASGSSVALVCSGSQGASQIKCLAAGDFAVGQGIRIVAAGGSPFEAPIASAPVVTSTSPAVTGPHTYCYVVDSADPLGGVSTPSPQACVSNEPDLGLLTTTNSLATTMASSSENPVGPSTAFLWYVSEDGGPFSLLSVESFTSSSVDMGQRVGPRGGWPDSLPQGNPDISKNQDLFSVVQAINGSEITLADPLITAVYDTAVDHDDTQAVESTILQGVQVGGATIVFGQGTFNLRKPAFAYVANGSYAYPPYTSKLSLDPWWARYSYLYIPNGSQGNINMQGAGRLTTLVTPPDHGGATSLLAVGNEQRSGAVGTPIMAMNDVSKGASQVKLVNGADASLLQTGDDVFIYSGSFEQAPDIDTGSSPDMHHFSEINSVAFVSGNTVNLVYPTTKSYSNDGASSFGLTKLPVTPHNIELQHFTIFTFDPITSTGDVIGMLINDVVIQGVMGKGAFGGGYKRGVTIENSLWAFGKGTAAWGQWDEYDQFTDLVFLNNSITGYAAPRSEGASAMAKVLASEGTSQLLFYGNTFDHASITADQTNECYIQNNSFIDGIVTAGVAYSPEKEYFSIPLDDRSFLSFGSQEALSVDHNSFNITPGFAPPWVIRGGDFTTSNISDNTITYSGEAPWFIVGSLSGSVLDNTIVLNSPAVGIVMELVPDMSPTTPTTSLLVQGNRTAGDAIIKTNVRISDPGFTDTAPVCIRDNVMQVSQGAALDMASSVVNVSCP